MGENKEILGSLVSSGRKPLKKNPVCVCVCVRQVRWAIVGEAIGYNLLVYVWEDRT